MRENFRNHRPKVVALVAAAGVVASGVALTSRPATASPAINATTLNGLRASQIVRASSVRSQTPIDNFDGCSFQHIQTVRVRVPGKGFLMIWATIGAARDADNPNPATLTARIRLGRTVASNDVSTHLSSDGAQDGHVSLSGMAPVAKKGRKTVSLVAKECTSGMAYIVNSSIQTLYVPFGSSSVITPKLVKPANQN